MKRVSLVFLIFAACTLFAYSATAGNNKAKLGPCVRDCVRAFNPSLADSGADEFLVTSMDMEDCVDICNEIIVPGESCYPWTDGCCHPSYEDTDPDCGALPGGANCSENEQCLSDVCDFTSGEAIGVCADPVSYAGTWIFGWVPSDDDCFDDHASMGENIATQDGNLLTFTDPNDPMDVKTGELVGDTWTYLTTTTTNGETETEDVVLTFLSENSLRGKTHYTWTDGTQFCSYHDDIWGWKVPTYDPPEDISGDYEFYHQGEGDTYDQLDFVTAVQDGESLTLSGACGQGGGVLAFTGSYADGFLTLTMDTDPFELLGFWAEDQLAGTYKGPDQEGTWRLVEAVDFDCGIACEPVEPFRFVNEDIMELDKIERISLFRSGYGHDYSDFCESCRSMKHYFEYSAHSDDYSVKIFSPVDGIISEISTEGDTGDIGEGINKQIRIRSTAYPAYTFIIFHVDLIPEANITGKSVQAGEFIGYAHTYNYSNYPITLNFDLAVQISTPYGRRYVSYFDVMTEVLFANYQARGAVATSDFIISREERDDNPKICDGDTFIGPYPSPLNDWFELDLEAIGAYCESNEECASNACSGNICQSQ